MNFNYAFLELKFYNVIKIWVVEARILPFQRTKETLLGYCYGILNITTNNEERLIHPD